MRERQKYYLNDDGDDDYYYNYSDNKTTEKNRLSLKQVKERKWKKKFIITTFMDLNYYFVTHKKKSQ